MRARTCQEGKSEKNEGHEFATVRGILRGSEAKINRADGPGKRLAIIHILSALAILDRQAAPLSGAQPQGRPESASAHRKRAANRRAQAQGLAERLSLPACCVNPRKRAP